MANLNRVFLIGNLTRDPEVRVTPKGTAICQFGLAVSRQYKDESGQSREETTFVDVEAWGRQGETIGKYCTKGRPLFVEGRLRLDTWDDKTSGQKRSRMKVVLENFQFLGGGRGEGGGAPGGSGEEGESSPSPAPYERSSPPPRAPQRYSPPPQQPPSGGENLDEDVPF